MKKVISWILFILALAFFLFDAYFAVAGTIEVDLTLDRIEEMGGSGVDRLGSGADVFVMILALISIEGLIFSVLSAILAQKRVIKIISFILILLFIFVPLLSYGLYLFIA